MINVYLIYSEQTITDFNPDYISTQYAQGYLFGRRHHGDMYQTRSLRIDLTKFTLSSENRRVIRKNETLNLAVESLPYPNYSWEIHQLGKQFYTTKFGEGTMSASKIKSMFTEPSENNMNTVLVYTLDNAAVGYCLTYKNAEIMHYAYPFYKLDLVGQTTGIAMMTKAIVWAQQNGLNYIYLGSVADAKAKYKLQFSGLEWWNNDAKQWSNDIETLKALVQPQQ